MFPHTHACPAVDKFVAVIGNLGTWGSALFTGSTVTTIGAFLVSLCTAFYFVMRALHERQRMRHDNERHARQMESFGYTPPVDCEKCGASNPGDATKCEECGEEIDQGPKVIVTRWIHPQGDQALILKGTPFATRKEAEEYFEGSPSLLKGEPEIWPARRFAMLREFEA